MRQLLGSCKTQIEQLKSEVARYKKKWKDSISTIAKVGSLLLVFFSCLTYDSEPVIADPEGA